MGEVKYGIKISAKTCSVTQYDSSNFEQSYTKGWVWYKKPGTTSSSTLNLSDLFDSPEAARAEIKARLEKQVVDAKVRYNNAKKRLERFEKDGPINKVAPK